jgi:hypothetical protein
MPRRKRIDKKADFGLTREEVDKLLIEGVEPRDWCVVFDDDWDRALALWERHRDRIMTTYAGSYGEERLEPALKRAKAKRERQSRQ